jgi:signal transduction histidine kinase
MQGRVPFGPEGVMFVAVWIRLRIPRVVRIHEPYFSLKEGGTGLGLCMAKKIVENHGGVIWFESSKNKGTTFIVRLPLHKE